jgi:hypothetical protein
MGTIILIIVGSAVVCGIWVFLFSNAGGLKERGKEAGGAAAGGAAAAVGCLFQLIIPALMLLAGLWVLSKIFGS